MKRIRTEKENKVTHRSESSQPILRHRERRSTPPLVSLSSTPLLYHSSSLLPTPPTVLSHHPLFYNPVTVGVSHCSSQRQLMERCGTARRAAASHWRRLRLPPVASPRNGLCHHFLLCHHFRATSSSAPGLGTPEKLSGTLWKKSEFKSA